MLKGLNGDIVNDAGEIGDMCEQYNKKIYAPIGLPELDFIMFDEIEPRVVLDEDIQDGLIVDTSKEEIYNVPSTIHDNKALGNDEFTSYFFKVSWNIVGDDFMRAVQNLFRSNMLQEVNATCITLVPKVESPLSLGDYRPIAFCNVVYKCIAKILMNRMKRFMNVVFSPCQSAFVAGRSIQDMI